MLIPQLYQKHFILYSEWMKLEIPWDDPALTSPLPAPNFDTFDSSDPRQGRCKSLSYHFLTQNFRWDLDQWKLAHLNLFVWFCAKRNKTEEERWALYRHWTPGCDGLKIQSSGKHMSDSRIRNEMNRKMNALGPDSCWVFNPKHQHQFELVQFKHFDITFSAHKRNFTTLYLFWVQLPFHTFGESSRSGKCHVTCTFGVYCTLNNFSE